MPFISVYIIPNRYRLILAAFAAYIVYPFAAGYIPYPNSLTQLVVFLLGEIVTGAFIGFTVTLIVAAFQLASEFFSLQMGFAITELIDPLTYRELSTIGQFLGFIGLLIFISINGHLIAIEVIVDSFRLFPIFPKVISIKTLLIKTFADMFKIALKLSLPVVGAVITVTVALSVLAKFAPQMNILMIGFPIYILTGLLVLAYTSPAIVSLGRDVFKKVFMLIQAILR